ncbi:prepilin-type N-terminal cleavage/methylation domain-containing protein [Kiritimatiella glycovorans]|uniref:PilD-dependent protein PddA n=1 Tax=Kiritimatiella glycovorans TaxID=1307763 RepID=A0A0G3EF93_9BACT|nr:prepilin-type N-terminal cleavage/methylation domain-containing protein [Kiritimatiella glycovorans]AKJ65126.1 PilD-dependent protein PddA [Kiritimatiella glycovorans]
MQRRYAGFTLIELLTVMAIIGLLAGIVLGVSGYASRKAAEARAQADLQEIGNYLEEYRIELGRYPENSGNYINLTLEFLRKDVGDSEGEADGKGLLRLYRMPMALTCTNQVGNEIRLIDPWGSQYRYNRLSRYSYELWSVGPDGDDSPNQDRDSLNNRDNIYVNQ